MKTIVKKHTEYSSPLIIKNLVGSAIFLMVIIVTSCTPQIDRNSDIPIKIDFSKETRELYPFWVATGYTPASLAEKPEMKQVLYDVGQLPDRGINFIRPHFLLNLVTVNGMTTQDPVYNWTQLDAVLDEYVNNDLKLIFELMGLPYKSNDMVEEVTDWRMKKHTKEESDFYDFTKSEVIHSWKKFITALIVHLEERYGKEEVRSWYFESTNEPDEEGFWQYDVATFLNYYDACSEGIKEADPEILFGGPGTARDFTEPFVQLLAHCDTGTNFFTGEKGVRLDFISVHVKDDPLDMLDRELKIVDYIRQNHPKFSDLPFINDEADPVAGWNRNLWWRTGAWYAAFVAQNIDLHQRILIDSAKVNYALQSNDHTFLGGWMNRTTHTLFHNQENKEQFRLVPKPVLTVMNAVTLLGDAYIDVDIPDSLARYFGVLATFSSDTSIVIMTYNKTDIDPNENEPDSRHLPSPTQEQLNLMEKQSVHCQLLIQNMPFKKFSLTEYRFDANHTNPHQKWLDMGRPSFPNDEQYQQLIESSKPKIVQQLDYEKAGFGKYNIELNLPSPGVSFLVFNKILKK
jgi:L-iduronidase